MGILPGVYFGYFKFLEVTNSKLNCHVGDIFGAVISLGSNPQFNQSGLHLVLLKGSFGYGEF